MAKVTYKGASARGDSSTVFYLDGVRLEKGIETEVPAELAKELREGSDRLAGHKFEVAGAAPTRGKE